MSLLMEALRKAEESKRKATEHSEDTEGLSPAEDHDENSLSEATEPALQIEPVSDYSLLDLDHSDDPSLPSSEPDHKDSLAEAKNYVNDISRLSLEKQDLNLEALDYEDQAIDQKYDFEPSTGQASLETNIHSSTKSESQNPHRTEDLQQRFNKAIEEEIQAPIQERSEFQRRQEDRMVAGAVFQAKKNNKNSRRPILIALILILLLLPCAAGLFWFYQSSLPPSTSFASMNNNPNRGFLGDSATDPVISAQEANSLSSTEEIASPTTSSIPDVESTENETSQATNPNSSVQDISQGSSSQAAISQATLNPPTITQEGTVPTQSQQQPLPSPSIGSELTFNPSGGDIASSRELSTDSAPQFSIQLRRTNTPPSAQTSPSDLAYEQLQSGNLEQAQLLYLEVLRKSPTNRQAMLGLASLYEKQGDSSSMQQLYTRMLRLNPRDPIALAGLSKLSQVSDPQRRETQLKALIEENPSLASLRFELGNLYASQQRWSEAEASYFTALANAKASTSNSAISPDYAFNLAVSLEQLNQPAPAYTYYLEAQELSLLSAPGFNTALLNQRLQFLEPQQ